MVTAAMLFGTLGLNGKLLSAAEVTGDPTMSVQDPDVYLNTMETSQAATSFITVEVHKEWQNLPAGTIPGPITVELRKQSNDEIVKTGVLNSGNQIGRAHV